jgi:hypothetical protein
MFKSFPAEWPIKAKETKNIRLTPEQIVEMRDYYKYRTDASVKEIANAPMDFWQSYFGLVGSPKQFNALIRSLSERQIPGDLLNPKKKRQGRANTGVLVDVAQEAILLEAEEEMPIPDEDEIPGLKGDDPILLSHGGPHLLMQLETGVLGALNPKARTKAFDRARGPGSWDGDQRQLKPADVVTQDKLAKHGLYVFADWPVASEGNNVLTGKNDVDGSPIIMNMSLNPHNTILVNLKPFVGRFLDQYFKYHLTDRPVFDAFALAGESRQATFGRLLVHATTKVGIFTSIFLSLPERSKPI